MSALLDFPASMLGPGLISTPKRAVARGAAGAAILAIAGCGAAGNSAAPTRAPLPGLNPQVRTDLTAPPGAREARPQVNLGAPGAASRIPDSQLVAANPVGGAPFRYSGIAEMKPGPGAYAAYRYPAGSITSPVTTGLSYRVEFVTDAEQLEVATVGNGAVLHVRVDGAVDAAITLPSDGTARLIHVAWPASVVDRRRRILLEYSNGGAFAGVRVARGQQIEPPPEPPGPRMIVVGDSWTDGTGSDGINDHAYVAGQVLGIRDTWVAGIGGTGYLQDSALGQHIGARIQTDVIDHRPAAVVFCYGSDDSRFTPQAIASAAAADWREVRVALPNTRIVVEGPWPAVGANIGQQQAYAAIDRTLQQAARAQGLPYVSPVQGQWIRGAGYVGHPSPEGNSTTLIGPDGIHPTPAGHQYVGRLEAAAWAPLLGARS